MSVMSVKSELSSWTNRYVASWFFSNLLVPVHRNHKCITVSQFTELNDAATNNFILLALRDFIQTVALSCSQLKSHSCRVSSVKLVNVMQRCVSPFHDTETTLYQWLMEHLPKVKETKALLVNHLCSSTFICRMNLSSSDPLTLDGRINKNTIWASDSFTLALSSLSLLICLEAFLAVLLAFRSFVISHSLQ